MARFILVHGAWHGGWCWDEVSPRLNALGHQVRAPDLPGMGADAASGPVATLDEWAMFIAGMASAQDEPSILVGHSRGGIVISRAAELAPQAVRRLVYLAAVMPSPGETMADLFQVGGQDRSPQVADAIGMSDDGRTMIWHSRKAAISTFYGTTPSERADAAFARLTAEPANMRTTAVLLSSARYGAVPRSYIHCEEDRAVTPDLQRLMVARQPCDTYSLKTDHSPFYSAPDELTALLQIIASN